MTENSDPRNPNPKPATGKHGPNCPPRNDGDGGLVECTAWDHDAKLWDPANQ
jgi:hypothetical protein